MSYGVYERNGRWAGYGVPAICDYPACGARIDRGLGYICEGPMDSGCGLFFCSDHLWLGHGGDQLCQRCCDDEPPFDPTPDTPEWIKHMLTDETWQQWRDENPAAVQACLDEQP